MLAVAMLHPARCTHPVMVVAVDVPHDGELAASFDVAEVFIFVCFFHFISLALPATPAMSPIRQIQDLIWFTRNISPDSFLFPFFPSGEDHLPRLPRVTRSGHRDASCVISAYLAPNK